MPDFTHCTSSKQCEMPQIHLLKVSATGGNSLSTRVFVDDEEDSDDDEGMVFFPHSNSKTESSHDLD